MEATTILFDNMLMLDRNLNPKIIHSQNVWNEIGLVATQIVNGVADANMTQFVGSGLYGLIPSRAIVEVVFYPQLFAGHFGAIVGRRAEAPTILYLFQFEMLASVEPVNNAKHLV